MAGEPFRLTSNRAQELDIASHVVDNFDDFKQLYGFTSDLRTAEPNWASNLWRRCRRPRSRCCCW